MVTEGRSGKEERRLSRPGGRFWQLDFVRGTAVLLMIYYHYLWDLYFFGLSEVDVTVGGWRIFARIVAATFLLLVGISIIFAGKRKPSARRDWLRRGASLLALAFGITVVTRVFLGDAFILFGVLHLIGVTMLLAPLLWRVRRWAPLIGIGLVAAGLWAQNYPVDTYWLLPFGLYPDGYPAVDYFPLLPWLGVIMVGIGVGRGLYFFVQRRGTMPKVAPPVLGFVSMLGRHSLLIYVVHQPVLLAGFWILGYTVW